MIKNRIIAVLSLFLLANLVQGQVYPDRYWLFGAKESSGQPGYGNAFIRFHQTGLELVEEDLNMNFESTAASMVDSLGKLIFYTNGCYVANALGDTMENGAGLNPGEMNDWTCGTSGYVAPFGAMAIPLPGSNSKYILLHIGVNYDLEKKLTYGPFYYSLIDMTANGGLGKVVSKNNILVDKRNLAPFSAVRHGNGRDWWVVVPEYGTDAYHKFLISNTGVYTMGTQNIGESISCRYIGTGAFSLQGDRYARQHNCGIFIYDFNRCLGSFSNPRHIPFPPNAFGGGGVAFTPDGTKILTSTQMAVMAVNLKTLPPTLDTIVDFLSLLGTSLGLIQYGGDGRLYFSTMGRGSFYHVCNTPSDPMGNIGFQFKGQALPVQNMRTLPNLPNFRLYDFHDSPCDTLGISVSAIEEPNIDISIKISPNPASDRINIQWNGGNIKMLNLYDIVGNRLVQLSVSAFQEIVDLDVSNLSSGVYCIILQDNSGKVFSKIVAVH